MPKAEKLAQSPQRIELAAAIQAAAAAEVALSDAQSAADRAASLVYSTRDKLAALHAKAEAPPEDDDAFIETLLAGGDVATLTRPRTELLKEIEQTEAEIEAWRAARNRAEQSIPIRARAVEDAKRKTAEAARAVLANETDVAPLLERAEAAAAQIVGLRAALSFMLEVLPEGAEKARVSEFLARPWLLSEFNDGWRRNPAVQPLAAALSRLQSDADAAVPGAE